MSAVATPEWVFVTPEMADEWLAFNTNNRNVRQPHVDKLAETLVDYHPSTIVRNCDGTLLDGQHRLLAIRQRGKGAWMLVIEGVPSEMQNMIDTGKTRTNGDVLGLNGYSNRNALASAARTCMLWERDPSLTQMTAQVMPVEVLRYVEQHPELLHHVEQARSLSARSLGLKQPTGSRLAVCRIAIERAFGEAFADAFLRSLVLGVDISEDSVIYKTRSRLMSISSGKDHAIGLSPNKNARMAMWMVLRCAVAHRNGESMKKIIYRSDDTPMPILLDGTLNKENNA
jgi:hypothetical protein